MASTWEGSPRSYTLAASASNIYEVRGGADVQIEERNTRNTGRADRGGLRRQRSDTATDVRAGRVRAPADYRRVRRREHARAAGARELPPRRAWWEAVLRQRLERPAV